MRGERGQTATEYLGLLALVAAIILAIASAGVGTQIGEGIQQAICRILGGECGAPAPPPPSQCVVAEATDKFTVNGEVSLRIVTVKGERGVEYARQKRADGKVAMTFKLNGAAGIGGRIPKALKGKIAAAVNAGGSAQVTFVLPDDAAANRFAGQIKDAVKAAASPRILGWVTGGTPHIDWPQVESVAYQGSMQANAGVGIDSVAGYADAAVEGGAAIGIRKNLTDGLPDSGDLAFYYKLNAKGSGNAGGHLIGPNYSGALAGDLTLSVILDKRGAIKTLSILGQGGYEGGDVPRVKLSNIKEALKRIDGLELKSGSQSGRKVQFQVDLDVRDPQVQALVVAFLRGVNPVGGPVDRGQAAAQLWNTIEQKGKIQLRHYDTDSHNDSAQVDAIVAGGGFARDTTEAELSSAEDYRPGEGFIASAVCRR
jgi:hypothetical protein